MEYGRQGGLVGGNMVQMGVEMQGLGGENWTAGGVEQEACVGEDDYSVYSSEAVSIDASSNFNYDGRLGMSRSGSEPPNKKPRDSQFDNRDRDAVSRSKAIGKMFFKTKLCCKFRAGTCPYVTNCNFAHGIEELRKPPPNWQEIVAAEEEERAMVEPREEHQIPALSSTPVSGGESQRSYKGRHCKKFYTEEGCPYGDNCTFLHDEQSKARESVAISLGPTGGYGTGPNGPNQKPSNWKTRICNKWKVTGYCPFGAKCHFAHGMGELHRYGGGLVEDGRDSASGTVDSKLSGGSAKVVAENAAVTGVVSSNHTVDIYHMGLPSQRSLGVCQRQGQRPMQKWKGPDKISLIYGDWLEEIDPDRI